MCVGSIYLNKQGSLKKKLLHLKVFPEHIIGSMVQSRNSNQGFNSSRWNTAEKNLEAPFQTSGKQCHEINGVFQDGRAMCVGHMLAIPEGC